MRSAISSGVDRSGALNTVKAGGLVFGDIVPILRDHGIHEESIFYGLEEIVTDRLP